ncbi:unnamed protein product, partial [Mesorhabditis spiculigera]
MPSPDPDIGERILLAFGLEERQPGIKVADPERAELLAAIAKGKPPKSLKQQCCTWLKNICAFCCFALFAIFCIFWAYLLFWHQQMCRQLADRGEPLPGSCTQPIL